MKGTLVKGTEIKIIKRPCGYVLTLRRDCNTRPLCYGVFQNYKICEDKFNELKQRCY